MSEGFPNVSTNSDSSNNGEEEKEESVAELRRSVRFQDEEKIINLSDDLRKYLSKRNSVVTSVSYVKFDETGKQIQSTHLSSGVFDRIFKHFRNQKKDFTSINMSQNRTGKTEYHYKMRSSARYSRNNNRLNGFSHYCYNTLHDFEKKFSS